MVILSKRKIFPWYHNGKFHMRGIVYNKKEKEIKLEIDSCKTIDQFINIIHSLQGCFCIIKEFDTHSYWVACDVSRTFPVFYDTHGEYISDCIEEIKCRLNTGIQIDEVGYSELLLSMNTQFNRTVYKEIKQCCAGEVVEITNKGTKHYKYYHHYSNSLNLKSYGEKKKQLYEIIDYAVSEAIQSIGDRPIVVPLSGGYDSRVIVSILKKYNIDNVICYTYGNKEDYEVQYSKIIAEKLGYKWYFTEYTKEKWKDFWKENNIERINLFEDEENGSSLPHIQDYIALKEMKEKDLLPENAVVLNGFCADLPAGSFVTDYKEGITTKDLANICYEKHYINTIVNDRIQLEITNEILNFFNDLFQCSSNTKLDKEKIIKGVDCWFTDNRPTRWVVNSCKVYEHFGLEWRLPFWNKEFLDFCYSLLISDRKECKLYIDTIFEYYFKPLHIDLKKPKFSVISKNTNTKVKQKIIEFVKKQLIIFGFNTGIFIYNRNNINNYNYCSYILFKKLKYKKAFAYRYKSVHQMEALWWCENKYGLQVLKNVLKRR